MFNNKKPLFSRPALAALMVLSTLVIWVLNLTAPTNPFPTMNVTTWNTTSGIPVIWLSQESWQNTNKLELRFSFNNNSQDTALTKATLALLMSDSLPLSTSTINQRLAPLSAKVSSYYDLESQTIGLTLNSELNYLSPTLDILKQWLPSPIFKPRTFDRWSRQEKISTTQLGPAKTLFPYTQSKKNTPPATITLDAVNQYYASLQQNTAAIFIIGNMTEPTKTAIKTTLDTLSKHFLLTTNHSETAPDRQINNTTRPSLNTSLIKPQIIALTPLSSVKEWISLQIWATDLVNTLNNQTSIDDTKLNLTLSAKHPWAQWKIQYADQQQSVNKNTHSMADITIKNFTDPSKIPSVNDKKRFTLLLANVKKQLKQNALDPSWWSKLAATSTQEGSRLTLEQFAKHYQGAINTFNQDDYKAALKTLFITSSYQEIQAN